MNFVYSFVMKDYDDVVRMAEALKTLLTWWFSRLLLRFLT